MVGGCEETAKVEVESSTVVEVACPELAEGALVVVSAVEAASGVEVATGATTGVEVAAESGGVEVASSARNRVSQPEKTQAKIIRNIIETRRNLLILNILVFHILFPFLTFYSISSG
jgi:hypothetical protein